MTCVTDFDCPSHQYCLHQACTGRIKCNVAADCLHWQFCDATTHLCMSQRAVYEPCDANAGITCLNGNICVNGHCRRMCDEVGGNVCYNGLTCAKVTDKISVCAQPEAVGGLHLSEPEKAFIGKTGGVPSWASISAGVLMVIVALILAFSLLKSKISKSNFAKPKLQEEKEEGEGKGGGEEKEEGEREPESKNLSEQEQAYEADKELIFQPMPPPISQPVLQPVIDLEYGHDIGEHQMESIPEEVEEEDESGRRSPFVTLEDLEGVRKGLRSVEASPTNDPILDIPTPISSPTSVRERAAELNEKISKSPVPITIPTPRSSSPARPTIKSEELPTSGSHYHKKKQHK